MNRPLVWVAVPFVTGTVLGSLDWPGDDWLAVVAGVGGALMVVFAGPSDRLVRIGVIALFVSGGVVYWSLRHAEAPGDPLLTEAIDRPDMSFELMGRVERPDILIPELGYGQFTLRVEQYRRAGASDWIAGDAGVHVMWTYPEFPVFSGDRVRVNGRLEHALSAINPDVSSYEDYLRRRDIHTGLRLRGGGVVEVVERGGGWSPTAWASRLRYAQAERLLRVVPEEAAPFVLTVWLGERRLIDNVEYRAYVESGTAHILAVSGVHTGIVYVSAEFLLLLLMRGYRYRRIRRILVLAAVFAFALVAGARISSMRAATMIALYVLAQLFDRDPDAPTALSLAALTFTLHDPDVVFDPGFILSFLAIASLLVFRKPIVEMLASWPGAIREGLAVALAVQIISLPAAASIFYIVPILGTLANLIVVPLLTVALWAALFTSILAFVFEPAAVIIGHALYPVVAIIAGTAELVSSLSGAYVEVARPTLAALGLYAAGSVALYRAMTAESKRRRWAGASLALFVVCAIVWSLRPAVDEVVLLDVGQGDATIVRTAERQLMVVDAGDRIGSVDYGERAVAAYLRRHGLTRIHALVGTHADKDHQGGMEYLVRHFRVDALYLTHAATGDVIETTLEQLCGERGVTVRRVSAGERIPLEGAEIRVLHPPADWDAAVADNERSIVLMAELAGYRFLLPGDIEASAESLLAEEDLRADVLKVPHHGSRTSSSRAFVDAVSPKLAVVSTGRAGRKRILSEAVLESYAGRGIEILRTDYAGGIRVRFGEGLEVTTARGARGYPYPGSGTSGAPR